MAGFDNNFFRNMERKTGVNMSEIFALANSLQNANFSDEKTVRGVIKRVAKIANRNVTKDVEDKLVQTIVKDGKKLDVNSITQLMNNTLDKK